MQGILKASATARPRPTGNEMGDLRQGQDGGQDHEDHEHKSRDGKVENCDIGSRRYVVSSFITRPIPAPGSAAILY